MLAVAVGIEALHPDHDVVGVRGAPGGVRGRQVGDPQEQVPQLGLHVGRLGLDGGELLAELLALRAEGLGPIAVLGAPGFSHLFGEGVDPAAQPVALPGEQALALGQRRRPVHVAEIDVAPGQGGTHPVQVVAQASDVDHDATVVEHTRHAR